MPLNRSPRTMPFHVEHVAAAGRAGDSVMIMQEREDIEARQVSEVKVSAELATLNPLRWLAACATDWTIIVIAMVAAHQIGRAWAYLFAIAIIGARQHALLLLGHDAAHYLVSRKKWLNDLLSNVLVAY